MESSSTQSMLVLAVLLLSISNSIEDPIVNRRGSVNIRIIDQTKGQPWPMPQSIKTTTQQLSLRPNSFQFQLNPNSFSCDILTSAFDRYFQAIFYPSSYLSYTIKPSERDDVNKKKWTTVSAIPDVPFLDKLYIYVQQPCDDFPTLESNESYSLNIHRIESNLSAISVWGALRGLETFSQLIYSDDNILFGINETIINDYPRFQHRGLLLDASRHFIPIDTLKMNLEAMAQSKMNVFHFHIVDDQSFPYQSRTYPDLSEKGSYNSEEIYSQSDIRELIEFARQRGIRVIVEFDSPGHTLSWGHAVNILTKCYTAGKLNGELGPIDPSQNSTFLFLKRFFTEIANVFPDHYIHLGGDEVDFHCWRSNPGINEFMKKMKFGIDYALLEQYYMQTLVDIISETGKGYAVWQEIIDHHVRVKQDTIVEVWKEPRGIELERVTALGYRAILSACWYLNLISYGQDWFKYYRCDPHDFIGTEKQKKLVVGGEACMWGEYVDWTNVIPTTWPRASVVAERLWSSAEMKSPEAAIPRLEEQRCRYIQRGIPAAPINGPSYCNRMSRP